MPFSVRGRPLYSSPVPLAAVIVLLIVSALAVGSAFLLGGLPIILIVPILLLLPGPFVTAGFLKRQLQRRKIATYRRQAQAGQTKFDARDEQTLA